MKNEVSLKEIKELCGDVVNDGDEDITVSDFNSITRAGFKDLSFWNKEGNIPETSASVIIVPKGFNGEVHEGVHLVYSDNPKLSFTRVAYECFHHQNYNGIVGEVSGSVVLMSDNINIGPNCSIGFDGFGYVRDEDGWVKFPHKGKVIIEDSVEIGANCCIDRGSLSDTIIHKGVKMDNHVHIAHNVEVGEDTLIVANVFIGGSVKIGKRCWIGPNVCIRDNITIGDDCMIGMGSVVTKDIPSGKVVYGVPAKVIRDKKDTDF